MTNLTPFGALFIILLVFAFGDFVGVVTKAKVSTMFVIMATFLVLFMTHAIPADICTTANLTYVTSIGLQFLLVDMGSSVGLTELKKEWRTVATATIALLLAVVTSFEAYRADLPGYHTLLSLHLSATSIPHDSV